nr:Biopolymer transport protein ExbB [Candidatus Pantoea persica]
MKSEQLAQGKARKLGDASRAAAQFKPHSHSHSAALLNHTQNELALSAGVEYTDGIKERTSFRLERRVAAFSRHAGRGNGFLTTIGSVAPFIGIAQTQTTNLAVVAPGIAEALLATVDVRVNLPVSTSALQPRPEKSVYLSIKADKQFYIGND